jgi:hypothetical protein
VNSGKAMVIYSPVKAAGDRYGPLFPGGMRGHRERPLKQGRAILVWNGCAYRAMGAGTQDGRVRVCKESFTVISNRYKG